jgi:DNA recombination protein RmuC
MNDVTLIIAATMVAIAIVIVGLRSRGSSTPAALVGALVDPEPLLAPIREQLLEIMRGLHAAANETTATRTTLTTKIEQVLSDSERNRADVGRLAETTVKISTALQGEGVRGDWGQLQLRRVVELAEMTEHVSFVEQQSISDAEGRITPDLIVTLPDDRCIVVDAKAPQMDFEGTGAISSAEALKRAIDDLAERNYGGRVDGAVDFTVLFVPSEGSLATALTEDKDLSEYGLANRVLLATPMTLLALLRAVEYGWKQVAQQENVKKIAKEATELCNRFGILAGHLAKIRSGLNDATTAYNDAVGSYKSRLIPQARKVQELGVDPETEPVDLGEASTELRSID